MGFVVQLCAMRILITSLFVLLVSQMVTGQVAPTAQTSPPDPQIVKMAANPAKGFSYPYYIYVPANLAAKTQHTILVHPNNTGVLNDNLAVHEADVKKMMTRWAKTADKIGVIFLMPVFPRSATDWKYYTHALDRDSMIGDKAEYKRFDLQMIAMIDDARTQLKQKRIATDKRVLMNGFSASGMFTNRFTFLHPTRVKAAVVGSPGGWPIAPIEKYQDKALRYPLGIDDIKAVSGKKLDLKNLRKVPMFIFLGDKDDNDSLPFGDGYEEQDKDLVFSLFGKLPVDRWATISSLYKQAGLNAEFKLYPDIGHMTDRKINGEISDFLAKHK